MPSINYTYKNPTTGAIANASDSVTFEMYDDLSGDKKAVLVATGASTSEAIRVDVTKQLKQALYGNGMNAIPDEYMSRLSAQEIATSPLNTTITVENTGAPTDALPLGLNLTAGDIVQFVNYFVRSTGAPHTTEYRYVVSVTNATDFVINTGLTNTYNKGALVFNRAGTLPLYGTGRGVNLKSGTKTQREAPTMQEPTVVWQASPAGFLVTVPADSSSQLVRGKVRVYVRSSVDDKDGIVEPHWVADAEITTMAVATLVTTTDGGTAAGGATITPGSTYQIHTTREDYTGAVSVAVGVATSVSSKLAQVAA